MSLQQVDSSDLSSQLGCHVPSQLQTVSSGAHLSAPLQFLSPSAVRLHCCIASTPFQLCLHYVSSAAFCQLICNLSALAYSVICCDIPAARHQLSYEVQDPLRSVISAAVCFLSHDVSAWQQSVSSAATGVAQLLCVAAQLSCYPKVQLQFVKSAFRSAATCQLSCTLLAHYIQHRSYTTIS